MKLKFIYNFLAFAFLVFVIMAHSQGRANDKNWGNTGAPGDEAPMGTPRTCVTCHNNSADIQVTLDINLTDAGGNSITDMGYMPGSDYTLEVVINSPTGTPEGHGFQILCLNEAEGIDGDEVSEYSNPSSNAQISFASNTNRTYVEQDGPSTSNTFSVTWTAPADLTGPVTFYSCGNGVNLNGMSSGDGAACNTLTVEEFFVSTTQLNDAIKFGVFPNPAGDYLALTVDGNQSEDYQLSITNIMGKQVHTGLFGNGQHEINIDFLPQGSYFLSLRNGGTVSTKKILKL